MTDAMSPKERWLAALRMKPVDRLPFWPKLGASYSRAQELPFRTMDLSALHGWMESDRHEWLPGCIKEIRERHSVETTATAEVRRTVYRTPWGQMEAEARFDVPSQSWHPTRFPVHGLEEIRMMTGFFLDTRVEWALEGLEKAQEQARLLGAEALTAVGIGTSPLMDWVEHLAGIEGAHLMLEDYPSEVEGLFEAMLAVLRRKTEMTAERHPADVLYFTENTSTTLVSPAQYRQYCFPHLADCSGRACARDRIIILHMCGHLKRLLPDLDRLPVRAFEAFTSPTLGDTTFLDGRTVCPEKCLVGGTNASLWTRPLAEILARLQADLDVLPHHRGLVVTSAGVMPPFCRPETIRQVCRWVKAYPHKN